MPSPIANATVQAAALSTLSNILAQLIEAYRTQRPVALDLMQLLRFVALSFITTPPNYLWQQLLERNFPAYQPASKPREPRDVEKGAEKRANSPLPGSSSAAEKPKLNVRNTLTKWFVDCITIGALMNTVAFILLMGIMKAQSAAQIQSNIRKETIPIIVAGYKIWPLASIISFSCVPVERRIVFLSFIGLLWGIYMSMVAARV